MDCTSLSDPLTKAEYYLLLRLPLSAAVKMGSFVVQLAQYHVVLEEKLVSHAESAEGNENMKQVSVSLKLM